MNGRAPQRLVMSWLALSAGLAGCDLSPLTSGDLFAHADAGLSDQRLSDADDARGDANDANDADDARGDALAEDVDHPDSAGVDATDLGDAASSETGADAGCAVSCGDGTFCNALVGKCQPSSGHSMLSGVVSDACDKRAVAALLGIAGQHQCGYTGKGAYFFSSLPIGLLELAVVKPGYLPYTMPVQIMEGGNIQDVVLTRVDDPDCTGERPVDKGCSCDGSVCTP